MKQTSASHPLQPEATMLLLFATAEHLYEIPPQASLPNWLGLQPWLRGTLCKTAPACQRMSGSRVGLSWVVLEAAGANPRGRLRYAKDFVQMLRFTPCLIFKYGVVEDPYLCLTLFSCSCSSFFCCSYNPRCERSIRRSLHSLPTTVYRFFWAIFIHSLSH